MNNIKLLFSLLFGKFEGYDADYDSSLPVRSEADGADERVQVKIVDETNPDTQQATVDTDKNVHVEVHGNRADDAADVAIVLSETGRVNPDGIYEADDNSKPASVGVICHVRNTTPDSTHQTLRVTGVNGTDDDTVWAQDVALHDADGDAFTQNNPLWVKFTQTSGTAVHDFKQANDIAKDASDTHTYTVPGSSVFTLTSIQGSASGKAKFEIKWGAAASEVLKLVLFNSTSDPNVYHKFEEVITLAATQNVLVVITNKDNQTQNVYSLIEGEVAAV